MTNYFKAELRSKKTQHPSGDKTVVVFVADELKKDAEIKAVDELKLVDPDNFESYKKPVVSEATQEEYDEYQARKSPTLATPYSATAEYKLVTPYLLQISVCGSDGGYVSSFSVIKRAGGNESIAVGFLNRYGDVKQNKSNAIFDAFARAVSEIEKTMALIWSEQEVTASIFMAKNYSSDNEVGTILQQFEQHVINQDNPEKPSLSERASAATSRLNKLFTDEQEPEADDKKEVQDAVDSHDVAEHEITDTSASNGGSGNDTTSNDSVDTGKLEKATEDVFALELEQLNTEIEQLKIGEVLVKEHVPNSIYHASIGYSSSNIKDELISSQYRHAKETGDIAKASKDCFNFGNLVHALILEPETIETEFVIEQPLPQGTLIKTDDYKAAIRAHNEATGEKVKLTGTKPELAARIKEFNPSAIFADDLKAGFEAQVNAGKTGVTQEQFAHAKRLINAAKNDPALTNWIAASGDHVHCERSYFWRDEKTNLLVKARPDKEIGNILVDVKTISVREDIKKCDLQSYLIREIEKRGYHLSAHHYMSGTKAQTFVWLFLNTVKGYEWGAIVQVTEEMLELGYYECRTGIESIAQSLETGEFKSPVTYPTNDNGAPMPIQADLSSFAARRLENYRNGMEY